MGRRWFVIAPICVFYLLQLTLVTYWIALSSEGASPVGVPVGVTVNILLALINVGVAAYILRFLDHAREAYAQDLSELLDQSIASYRQEVERDRVLMRKTAQGVNEELDRAREALETGDSTEVDRHLRSGLDLASRPHLRICDHVVAAAVLEGKVRQCSESGVPLVTQVQLPADLALPDIEVASVFFNLIDNALHECEALLGTSPNVQPEIRVAGRVQAGQLFVQTTNPCRPSAGTRRRHALRDTPATATHGWGTGIVKDITRNHGGLATFEEKDGTFVATVMIPLPQQP